MREIKFRVWNGNEMLDDQEAKRILYNLSTGSTLTPKHYPIMQYTGIKDMNGKEIYEGCIVKLSDGVDVSHHLIKWVDEDICGFWDTRLEDGDSLMGYDRDFRIFSEGRVIGNIYENPELLNEDNTI